MISPQELGTENITITMTLDMDDVAHILAMLDQFKMDEVCWHGLDWCGGVGMDADNSDKNYICRDCADATAVGHRIEDIKSRIKRAWSKR